MTQAIEATELSKRYRIGQMQGIERTQTLVVLSTKFER
jgi:hypothetical protein